MRDEDDDMEAFGAGKSGYHNDTDNPYPDGTREASLWYKGFNSAKQVDLERKRTMYMNGKLLLEYLKLDLIVHTVKAFDNFDTPWYVNSLGAYERPIDAQGSLRVQVWDTPVNNTHVRQLNLSRIEVVHGRLALQEMKFDDADYKDPSVKWVCVHDTGKTTAHTLSIPSAADTEALTVYSSKPLSPSRIYKAYAETKICVTVCQVHASDREIPAREVFVPEHLFSPEDDRQKFIEDAYKKPVSRDLAIDVITRAVQAMGHVGVTV